MCLVQAWHCWINPLGDLTESRDGKRLTVGVTPTGRIVTCGPAITDGTPLGDAAAGWLADHLTAARETAALMTTEAPEESP